jgi:hypothetical protein
MRRVNPMWNSLEKLCGRNALNHLPNKKNENKKPSKVRKSRKRNKIPLIRWMKIKDLSHY